MNEVKRSSSTTEEFEKLGFRCLSPRILQTLDGKEITVKAYLYTHAGINPADRFYDVTYDNGQHKLFNETELITHIGSDKFNNL